MRLLPAVRLFFQRQFAPVAFTVLLAAVFAKGAAFIYTENALTYTETFDSMAQTTNFVAGWTSTDTTILLSDGSSNSGSIYNVGTTGATDRAFGSVASGTTQPVFGASFTNGTGSNIGTISFAGFMEQWRSGSDATVVETLPFQFSFNATSLTTGTWTNLDSFNLVEVAPSVTANGAINGNDAANRAAIAGTASVGWADGTTMWIRWSDTNNAGNDGLYAIDDFSLTVGIVTIKTLTWNPPPGTWDTTTTNWLNGATPAAFAAGDNVNLTQAGIDAGGSAVVVDAAGLAPGAINVSNATGTYTISGGALSGTGAITKTNAGTVVLATTYTNSVVVNGGIFRLGAADRIGDSASVGVAAGATFDTAGFNETITALALTGGTVTTGAGTLVFTSISSAASPTTALITGILDTGTTARTITAADGGAAIDLQIDASVTGFGRTSLVGPGVIALNGDNAGFFENFVLTAGVTPGNVLLGNSLGLGSGILFFNGGTLNAGVPLTGTNAILTRVSLGGNGILGGANADWAASWTFAFSGTTPQARTLTINNQTTFASNFLSTDATGDTLTLNGTGSAIIAGPANVLGLLNVDGIAARISGTITNVAPEGAPAVANVVVRGGSLTGGGSISGLLTVGDDATALAEFSPGDAGIGTFTTGGLSLKSDATFTLELQTSGTPLSDQVISTGAVDLGAGVATLTISDLASSPVAVGFQFTIIDNQSTLPTAGFFKDRADGSTFALGANFFQIRYGMGTDANDVMLISAVPEPTALGLLAVGAVLIGGRRRRR